jgi:hypothetical protein
MKSSRRLRLSLITIAVGLFVGLLTAEAAVRVFDLASPVASEYDQNVPDPHLPFKPRPMSVTGTMQEYRHNSVGFRDVEHAPAKPANVFRILGLGDSFTYGGLTDFETSYLYRLEEMINARPGSHPKVEIIKAGISRFWPLPERLLLEHYGVSYSPDLVLVGFLPNDVIDTLFGIDAVTVDESGYLMTDEAAALGRLGTVLYVRSHLARLVLETYVAYRISRKYAADWDAIYRANGRHEEQWKEVEAEYGKMVTIAGRLPARLVIVNIPHRGPWTEKHAYPGNRLSAWAASNGAGFVDVLPWMMRESGGKPLYLEEGHCTVEGYGVIARAIYEYLTVNHMVP